MGKGGFGAPISETKVDITLEWLDEHGESLVGNGILLTEWAKVKLAEFPVLRPLCYLLKQLLHNNHLNVPYQGK